MSRYDEPIRSADVDEPMRSADEPMSRSADALALALLSSKHMTTRTYGLLASAASLALGAWWWNRRRAVTAGRGDRGTVIFDNTPTPTGLLDEAVV
jgi:hypothetical protein